MASVGAIRRQIGPVKFRLKKYIEDSTILIADAQGANDKTSFITAAGSLLQKVQSTSEKYNSLYHDLEELSSKSDDEIKRLEDEAEAHSNFGLDVDEAMINLSTFIATVPHPAPSSSTQHHSKSIRLPKLDIVRFDGNPLRWNEFWDSFESAIHENTALKDVEKMNYLFCQLMGEAKSAVEGLQLTNDNYDVAISLLKERFGNKDRIIFSYYMELMELSKSSSDTRELRRTYDIVERHMRSLQALGEDITPKYFIALIMSKLPKDIVQKLEENREWDGWTVESLREKLKKLLSAKEISEQSSSDVTLSKEKPKVDNRNFTPTTKTLLGVSTSRQTPNSQHSMKKCRYCGKDHWSDECRKFPTVAARKQRIKGSCYNCLRGGHQLRSCPSQKSCIYCGKKGDHHRSLCMQKFPSNNGENVITAPSIQTFEENAVPSNSGLLAVGEEVLLQTAVVLVSNPANRTEFQARVVLDTASHRSYITTRFAEKLRLSKVNTDVLSISTFGSETMQNFKTFVVNVNLKLKDNDVLSVSANVVPTITGKIFSPTLKNEDLSPWLQTLELAAPVFPGTSSYEPDLLIGNDYYCDLVTFEKIKIKDGLYFLSSKLGWMLTGRFRSEDLAMRTPSVTFLTLSQQSYENQFPFEMVDPVFSHRVELKNLWSLDVLGVKDNPEEDNDDYALSNFNETIKFHDNRYHVTWPWKNMDDELPDNYALSLGRLNSVLKRFNKNPDILKKYHSIIEDQFKQGVIEKVQETDSSSRVHYLPHHPVITPLRTTTKIRIVYDGSAKTKKENPSLNECLHRGPVLLEDICGLLIRFRLYRYACVADIEKAFLQVSLQPTERDVTRFLWLLHPDIPRTENNIQIFRFTRVPFGIICSPFLLAATIQHHLKSKGVEVPSDVMYSFYVDNLITGRNDHSELEMLYRCLKRLFSEMSMNLREWASNSEIFTSSILDVDRANSDTISVLGLKWELSTDSLFIKKTGSQDQCFLSTKRNVLKFLSSFFDPLGYFAPVLLPGKAFLQKLWKEKIDWDDILPDRLREEWKAIVHQIVEVTNFSIPRFIGLEFSELELHCFVDASKVAYAAAIYLRISSYTEVKTALIFAKARLAPVKEISLPRLELLASVVGCRLVKMINSHLKRPIGLQVLWTDSQCVLSWLQTSKLLPRFVANRVKEVKALKEISFRYVPTKENPADVASRGSSSDELKRNSLWWVGPMWLKESQSSWPHWKGDISPDKLAEIEEREPESRILFQSSSVSLNANSKAVSSMFAPFEIEHEKFSSLIRLLRVTAWALRFAKILKRQIVSRNSISAKDIEESRFMWEKFVQSTFFGTEIHAINSRMKNSTVDKLKLWLDDTGFLRCGGRLSEAEVSYDSKFPKLLPYHSHFTDLVIRDFHFRLIHAGVAHTLSQIRTQYWIPHGRSVVRRVINQCLICRKFSSGPYALPPMPPLPFPRVTSSHPFSYVGLDYLGPLYTRSGQDSAKVYICLFTCLSIRALHLEVAEDLTAFEFLSCLRKFIARRGKPTVIMSDNAPQFKLVKSTVEIAWSEVSEDPDVMSYVNSRGIQWLFIPEYSPWMGGFYERLVGMVKQALRKSIGNALLSVSQLQTIVTEIEGVLNSRPLVYADADLPNDSSLTPAHFLTFPLLTGTPVNGTTEETSDPDWLPKSNSREDLLKKWRKGLAILDIFWERWRGEYLLSLRERYQSHLKEPRSTTKVRPQIGDVVHLKDKLPRGHWKLARIKRLFRSHDGEVRSASVSMPSGRVLTRPLSHLYPLELRDANVLDIKMDTPTDPDEDKPKDKGVPVRSIRSAARAARLKIKNLLRII